MLGLTWSSPEPHGQAFRWPGSLTCSACTCLGWGSGGQGREAPRAGAGANAWSLPWALAAGRHPPPPAEGLSLWWSCPRAQRRLPAQRAPHPDSQDTPESGLWGTQWGVKTEVGHPWGCCVPPGTDTAPRPGLAWPSYCSTGVGPPQGDSRTFCSGENKGPGSWPDCWSMGLPSSSVTAPLVPSPEPPGCMRVFTHRDPRMCTRSLSSRCAPTPSTGLSHSGLQNQLRCRSPHRTA